MTQTRNVNFESTNKDVDKGKYVKDIPKRESVEIVLMDCNLVNNSNEKAFKVLCTLVPNKHKNTITEFHSIQL